MWDNLRTRNLRYKDQAQATFQKKFLCVFKYTPSHLAYEFTNETFYLEDQRLQVLLPSTAVYENVIKELKQKTQQIKSSFYTTTAMKFNEWGSANYDLRHAVARFAVHHRRNIHQPAETCMCVV